MVIALELVVVDALVAVVDTLQFEFRLSNTTTSELTTTTIMSTRAMAALPIAARWCKTHLFPERCLSIYRFAVERPVLW